MGLLEELKTKRQDAIENIAAQDLDIEAAKATLAKEQELRAFWVARIADLDRAIAALQPGALTEDERAVREINAYVGGRKDGYEQAIAALSPAPSEGDALGEFMKREGAAAHEGFGRPVDGDVVVEICLRDGSVLRGPAWTFVWIWTSNTTDATNLVAYRIISAPSEEAGKGEDAPEIPEGFTKWEGGECPVAVGDKIEVMWRSGDFNTFIINEGWMEKPLWQHGDNHLDIIAYRVLPSEPAAEEVGEGSVEMDEPFEAGDETDEDYEPEEIVLSPFRFRDCTFDDKSTPDTITIASSSQHAEESSRAQSLPPLLPPEPPPAATPEQLEAVGVIDGEAGWWGRKLMKERA